MFFTYLIQSILQRYRKRRLLACGENVRISKNCVLQGNIYIGNNVTVGVGNYFVSTLADLHIGDNVVFGPNVTIYTGDHPINIVGKHISDITDSDKKKMTAETGSNIYDKDVVIESGCWIGTRAIILKGVTIGKGCVIGAGAIVTKNVPPYTIYVGCPPVKMIPRFSREEIIQHESLLKKEDE